MRQKIFQEKELKNKPSPYFKNLVLSFLIFFKDFEKQILFLINDCGFSLDQISYNPLLLITPRNLLTERILFLRSIGKTIFDVAQGMVLILLIFDF